MKDEIRTIKYSKFMAQFNVLLPENLKEKLQKEKDKTGQSIASLIRTAIIEYFERRGK